LFRRLKGRPFAALALQCALVAALYAALLLVCLTQSPEVGGALYDAGMWTLMPLLGGLSAYVAARLGLHHYLAWIAPPLLQVGIHVLLVGLPPTSPGMPMVTLVVAAFGAAAGEEHARRIARSEKDQAQK